MRRVVDFQGTNLGSRIREQLELYINELVRTGKIDRQDSFLWKLGGKVLEPRNFEGQPKKDIEMIDPKELPVGMCVVAKESFAAGGEELLAETARRLGFKLSDKVRSVLQKTLMQLIKENRFHVLDNKRIKLLDANASHL